jgi:hypothetical protein
MKLGSSPESFTPFVLFKAFLPLAFMLSSLEAMNVAVADSNFKDCPTFTLPELLVFLGLLIRASRFPFCTHEELRGLENTLNHHVSSSLTFRSVMSATRFRQWKRLFKCHTDTSMGKTLANNTSLMLTWISELNNTQWTRVFSHGTIIKVDKTVFSWVGQCGDLHLTFIPLKPQPLGWMLKTSACDVLRVYIFLELAQCKDNMSG